MISRSQVAAIVLGGEVGDVDHLLVHEEVIRQQRPAVERPRSPMLRRSSWRYAIVLVTLWPTVPIRKVPTPPALVKVPPTRMNIAGGGLCCPVAALAYLMNASG